MIQKPIIATASEPEKKAVPAPAPARDINPDDLPVTTGERAYDALQFTVGKAMIMVATGVIAYVARYGKDKYGVVPNYFKQFQGWCHHTLLHNKIYPLKNKGPAVERIAEAFSNTTLLFHGGNLFAPIMKVLENNRNEIAGYVNRHYGKPGEEAISDEKFKNMPHQTWGDVIKGRIGAWLLVFTGLVSADLLIGKDKKTNMYWFDKYEEWFGRWMAGFTKAGKEIAKVPLGQALTEAQSVNKIYRFGRITAIDLYATSAGIIIWTLLSRGSAEKRHNRGLAAQENKDAAQDAAQPPLAPTPETPEQAAQQRRYTKTIKPCAPCMLAAHMKHAGHGEHVLANRTTNGETQLAAG